MRLGDEVSYDDAYDDDGRELFDDMDTRHESVWFVVDEFGDWWARVAAKGPGYMSTTYWKVDDADSVLLPMLEAGRRRDRGTS